MKALVFVGFLAALVTGIKSEAQRPVLPPGLSIELLGGSVNGDTLIYTLRWTAGSRAVAYGARITPSTTSGAWTITPNGTTVTALSYPFRAVNTTYDGVTFTAAVWSIGAGGLVSKDTSRVVWQTTRRPGGPGPVVVDSSLVLIGMRIMPDSVSMPALATSQQQFCPVLIYYGGRMALPVQYRDKPACVEAWSTIPEEAYPSPDQQTVADSTCIAWQATGGNITAAVCGPITVQTLGLIRDSLRIQTFTMPLWRGS